MKAASTADQTAQWMADPSVLQSVEQSEHKTVAMWADQTAAQMEHHSVSTKDHTTAQMWVVETAVGWANYWVSQMAAC